MVKNNYYSLSSFAGYIFNICIIVILVKVYIYIVYIATHHND